MKIIITGMNGTVAPVLAAHLQQHGHSVTAWNRNEVPPDHEAAVEDHVARVRPDAICHLANGSATWAETLARSCHAMGARFLYTSSVSVFSTAQSGPFTIDHAPQPTDEYGRYKLECEQRVRAVNANAVVARLGWQIGTSAGSNNMIDYLTRKHDAGGEIDASENWLPACSFLSDTVAALAALLVDGNARGIYHFESNPGLSFFEIATRLNARDRRGWNIRRTTEPRWDQRLIDPRVRLASLTARL